MLTKNFLRVAALSAALLITGCNGAVNASASSISLNSFSVTGTGGQTTTAPAPQGQALATQPINSSQNGGEFTIAWTTDAPSTLYSVDMYVSTTPTITVQANGTLPSTATQIFYRNCNIPGADCTGSGMEICQFTYNSSQAAANVICPMNQPTGNTTNIEQYLTQNGGTGSSYYLVMKACVYTDSQGDQACSSQAVPVLFSTSSSS